MAITVTAKSEGNLVKLCQNLAEALIAECNREFGHGRPEITDGNYVQVAPLFNYNEIAPANIEISVEVVVQRFGQSYQYFLESGIYFGMDSIPDEITVTIFCV